MQAQGLFLTAGYEKKDTQYIRKVLRRAKISAEEAQEICLEYPENNLMLAGFEIHTHGICVIYSGEYITEIEEDQMRHVSLHLCTTTFKKEDGATKITYVSKDGAVEL